MSLHVTTDTGDSLEQRFDAARAAFEAWVGASNDLPVHMKGPTHWAEYERQARLVEDAADAWKGEQFRALYPDPYVLSMLIEYDRVRTTQPQVYEAEYGQTCPVCGYTWHDGDDMPCDHLRDVQTGEPAETAMLLGPVVEALWKVPPEQRDELYDELREDVLERVLDLPSLQKGER